MEWDGEVVAQDGIGIAKDDVFFQERDPLLMGGAVAFTEKTGSPADGLLPDAGRGRDASGRVVLQLYLKVITPADRSLPYQLVAGNRIVQLWPLLNLSSKEIVNGSLKVHSVSFL